MKEASQKQHIHTYMRFIHILGNADYSEQRLITGCLETKVVEQRGMEGGEFKRGFVAWRNILGMMDSIFIILI